MDDSELSIDAVCCTHICLYFWSFFLSIMVFVVKEDGYLNTVFFPLICYIAYLLIVFNDTMFTRIFHSLSKQQFIALLSTYIKSNAKLEFYYSAYHTVEEEDKDGNTGTTYKRKEIFKNHSLMDISGKISLESPTGQLVDYIKIEIVYDYLLDCPESYIDENSQYDKFYNTCLKEHDNSYNLSGAEVTIDNVQDNTYYVSIKNRKCCDLFTYTLCNLLCLSLCYKLYKRKRFSSRKITIRKLFSTRHDLTNPTVSEQFADSYPCICFDNMERVYFKPEEICHKNYIELRNDPITEEEYTNTKKFNKNLIYKKRLHTNSETIPLSNIDNNNNYVPPVITFQ